MSTNLPTALDEPRVVNADSQYDVPWMESVEERFQKLGGEAVEQRNRPFACCYPRTDSKGSGITPGTVVAVQDSAMIEPTIVPATSAILGLGARMLGIMVETAPPGARGRVAVGGVVPSDLTNYAGGAGYVGANATTGALEQWATGPVVGYVGSNGALVVTAGRDPIVTGVSAIALGSAIASYDAQTWETAYRWLRFTGSPSSGCVINLPFFDGASWFIENATGVSLSFHTSGSNVSIGAGVIKQLIHKSVLRTGVTVT